MSLVEFLQKHIDEKKELEEKIGGIELENTRKDQVINVLETKIKELEASFQKSQYTSTQLQNGNQEMKLKIASLESRMYDQQHFYHEKVFFQLPKILQNQKLKAKNNEIKDIMGKLEVLEIPLYRISI